MKNFNFQASTNVFFGKDSIQHLPNQVKQFGNKVLVAYGGGSIKKTGLYDTVMELLKDYEVHELAGIQPNPKVDSVNEGAKICKENQIDVIVAVGGGSTMDCAKAIACAAYYDGDAWDLVVDHSKIKQALPLITITTMAATGSECDIYSVISNPKTNEKMGLHSKEIMPRVAIMDPTYTCTLPKYQTAAGIADIMSHTMENYFSNDACYLTNRICEANLKTCIKYGKIAVNEPNDFEARSELLWASTVCMNGTTDAGKSVSWTCHPIEHELSAYYDITHGVGLAIVTPRWMRHILSNETVDKFVEFANHVWNIYGEDKYEVANKGIDALENFFKELEIPMTLSEVNIDETYFEEMAKHAVQYNSLNHAYVALKEKDIIEILKSCL